MLSYNIIILSNFLSTLRRMSKDPLANYFEAEEYEPEFVAKTAAVGKMPMRSRKANSTKAVSGKRSRSKKAKPGKSNAVITKDKYPAESLVKFMGSEKLSVSKTNYESVKEFIRKIRNTPLYFINAHACICDTSGSCHGDKMEPFFTIPNDAYILTFGTATDFSCLDEISIPFLLRQKQNIKDYLWIHSASDMSQHKEIGKTLFSVFADLKRATQSVTGDIKYPNLNYSFNNDKSVADRSAKVNPYGVYRIHSGFDVTNMNNTQSILPQDSSRNNWFLEDIIKEVYAKTGISTGIFLNGGCLSSCTNEAIGMHMNLAAHIMNEAHSIYPTICNTVTAAEIKRVHKSLNAPHDEGIKHPFTYANPAEMESMVKNELFEPKAVATMTKLYHPENKSFMNKL